MNTIKIYLDQSGELADLQKDFPLYQFQFNNKLLNIYIPRVLLGASAFIDDNINSGNACLVKMSYTMDWNGKTKTSDAFICRYVKDVTQNGITYSLFERTLPYAFTLYAGQGVGAPQLTVMACNVVEGSVVSTISAQPVALDVIESSTIFDIDDIPPSTALTELESQLNSVIADLALKQNKDDPEINPATDDPDTNDHTVAGNINTLLNDYKDINEFVRGDDGLAEQVADNTQDIENLKTFLTIGLNIVGTYEITSTSVEDNNQPPTPEELTTFIEGITGLDHLERGDACFVYWNNYQADDTQALYYWNGTVFNSLQMSPVHNAQNDIAGLIEGTYTLDGLSTPNTLMVDIQNGHIANIYRVDSNGNYIDLKSAMDQVIAKLVGNVPVNRATADKNGNDITTKYMTKGTALDDGASHRYVQEYASPRALYDLNYPDYALGQFKSVEVSDTSYNKTTTSPNAETQNLYTPLATLTKTLEADILLGDQNGLINRIWITANITEDVKLRIETSYIDGNNQTQILSIEETDTFGLVNGIAKLLQIESVFSGLTQPITLPAGTTLIQTIEVHRQVSTSANFTLLSNTTYNAYMTLNKIGYVRYALEQEPNAIETAADSSYINADGDLEVVGDGTIHYANGDSAPLTTIVKLPIDTTPTQNSTKPITSGGVKTYVDSNYPILEVSGLFTTTQPYASVLLTAEQIAVIVGTNTPILRDSTTKALFIPKNQPTNVTLPQHYEWTFLECVKEGTEYVSYLYVEYYPNDGTNSLKVYPEKRIELTKNKTGIIDSSSTNTQYPSAKAVYDYGETKLDKKTSGATYGVEIPDTSAYTANKTLATTDDVDTKLDKQTGTSTYPQAYTKGVDGTQAMMDITDSTANNAIVRRNGQQILVPQTPTSDSHATSKKYVDNGLSGKQATLSTAQQSAVDSGIDSTKVGQIATNTSNITNLQNNKLDKKPDGTNDLISNNKISTKYLPDEILGQLVFGGNVNANTAVATLSTNAKAKLGTASNTITLTNDTTAITGYEANSGIYYVVATAGTFAGISYSVGDWLISIGTKWDKVDNTDEVTSVKVDTGTGLTSSTPTAQTGAVSTTIGIASGYKLPTTTEWGNKLDKVTTTTTLDQVYVKNTSGGQEMLGISKVSSNGDTLVKRNTNGQLSVPTTPSANGDATSKLYVDTQVGYKQSTILQGTATIATTAWTTITASDGYVKRASITATGATSSMMPSVAFSSTDALSGNFSPICESGSGVIYIYAKETPSASIDVAWSVIP